MLVAGENLFEGAICVKIDNSFYLTQEGDQKNKLYVCMEEIKQGEEIKIVENLRWGNTS